MLICRSLLKLSAIAIVLIAGMGVADRPGLSQMHHSTLEQSAQGTQQPGPSAPPMRSLETLPDGDFQFCSQPEPTDWHDGAGVCLIVSKSDSFVEGYYGYPHSDHFICLKGEVGETHVTGEAFAPIWPGSQWEQVPTAAFAWDEDAHLMLDQAELIRTSNSSERSEDWILFHRAVLDLNGFYQYSRPRMTPPAAVCQFP